MNQKISINWHETYANQPTAVIDTDLYELPKLKYRSIFLNTNAGLSAEQTAVVGGTGPKRTTEILWGEDEATGFIWWISVDPNPKGHGACGGKFEMVDGSVRQVGSGWHGSPGAVKEIADVLDVSWGTTKYKNVKTAGFITLERARELLKAQLPDVEIIEDPIYGHTFKFKGYPSKREWVQLENARTTALRDEIEQDYLDVDRWHRLSKIFEDPRWVEARPYENIRRYVNVA